MDILLSILIGVSLAAACGFRVFVPMLVLCIAVRAGAVNLNPSLAFLASTPALICFSVATIAEILAYKIPWVDNALDSIASPAAVVAGTLAMASQFTFTGTNGDLMKWGIAAIVGGGAAGVVQATTVVGRGVSTMFTGGIGNPIFATVESGTSVVLSVLAVVVPVVAFVMLACILTLAIVFVLRWRARRAEAHRLVPVMSSVTTT
ncbi:MAG TPA: DUF4126 domain-containing protein [Phycisphaerales bacterium]|nr:DUF4126 domain-containing protein [Phycisphaerales bacterium]